MIMSITIGEGKVKIMFSFDSKSSISSDRFRMSLDYSFGPEVRFT